MSSASAFNPPIVTTASHELAWNRFCEKVYDCIPGICKSLCKEGYPICDLLDFVAEDILENEDPYNDMLYTCLERVNSRGYVRNPRHGTRLPGFPPFTEDLKVRAEELLEKANVDSYDFIEVFQDVVEHYLGWCKEIITVYWTASDIAVFQFLLGACSPDFYNPTSRISRATLFGQCDTLDKCPFPVPSAGRVEVVVHTF